MKKNFLILALIFSISSVSCSSISHQKKDVSATSNKIEAPNKDDSKIKEYIQLDDTQSNENIPQNSNEINDKNKQTKTVNPNDNQNGTDSKKSNIPDADISRLSTAEKNWFYKPRTDGLTPEEPKEVLDLINKYSGYYVGDTSKKVLYLTFDEGYENGYTAKILDTLKENNVKAAFFVTKPYVETNKDLIKRMVAEGHLVCNHSNTHPSMAKIASTDKDKFEKEFSVTEQSFENITGTKMPKFFRPPMGKYNELSLYYTAKLQYKTIFWSFAYADWEPAKQPSHEYARKVIMERTHNGSIILLHAVSKTNAELMDSLLKEWKSKGYEFKTLNDLP
jgi:peptidoglycan-N-acetylmuramic acid deacetylase